MAPRMSVTMLLLLVAAVMSGCGGTMPLLGISSDARVLPLRGGMGLVAALAPPVADVPIPIGFLVVASTQQAERQTGARQLRHVYQGRGSVDEVMTFYQRQLPMNGWTSVDEPEAVIGNRLTYAKGIEILEILAEKKWTVVTATITIGESGIVATTDVVSDAQGP